MGRLKRETVEDILTLGQDALKHLWKDEIDDVFVLTKRMEAYAYSKTVLKCYCWHRKTYLQLKKMGVIFDDLRTDDQIYYFKTSVENLSLILRLGGFKRRPYSKGKWIKNKEKRLGHKIFLLKISPVQFREMKELELSKNKSSREHRFSEKELVLQE